MTDTPLRVFPNWHNIPFLALPRAGEHAMAVRRPVVGTIRLADGRRLRITQGEYCMWPGPHETRGDPANVLPADTEEAS